MLPILPIPAPPRARPRMCLAPASDTGGTRQYQWTFTREFEYAYSKRSCLHIIRMIDRGIEFVKSTGITLEQVLSDAESLSPEDQAILAELLHNRRIESWRKETAAAARKAAREFRAGKLKPEAVDTIIKRLRSAR